MITTCACGTKVRVKDLSHTHKMRCPSCKAMLGPEITRQARRNADIVRKVAEFLAGRNEAGTLAGDAYVIAQMFAAEEEASKVPV